MYMQLIDRAFYDAVSSFESSDEARAYYYRIMWTRTGRSTADGREETVRDVILRTYAALFCDDMDLRPGAPAGPEEVEATADRLYVGEMGFDPRHWYRMQHHFPVIDEDNYDRFAALVISDLRAGELRDSLMHGGDMLMISGADPLHISPEERQTQDLKVICYPKEEDTL